MTLLITALVAVHLQLVVRVYDQVGVAPAKLDRARAVVGAILASAGIEPVWRPCNAFPCVGPVKPHEVAVRLVTSGPRSVKDSLGFSVIDVTAQAGSLATIYQDRVHELAMLSGADESELLGRAIAHEIGHVLIGTAGHSHYGLMRAVWASGELRRGMPSDWVFSDREAAELRRHLVARMRPPVDPVAIVASVIEDFTLPDEMPVQ